MKKRYVNKIEVNHKDLYRTNASTSDVSEMITEDIIIYDKDTGKPLLLYVTLEEELKYLRWAVKSQKYAKHKRSGGIYQVSGLFGYTPRVPLRQDYCTTTAMAEKYPKQHHVIYSFVENIYGYYEKYFPEEFKKHQQIVREEVLDNWTIGDTPFTSGIVNKNNPLNYHVDRGNFKGVLSNMVVLKKGVKGGHLIIPELDLGLEVKDSTLVIFNGQELIHGVSEIEYEDDKSYRYSIVYYSLESMWKCEPLEDELQRIRNRKTQREKDRLNPEHLEVLRTAERQQREAAERAKQRFLLHRGDKESLDSSDVNTER